jgi:hypothetical protein
VNDGPEILAPRTRLFENGGCEIVLFPPDGDPGEVGAFTEAIVKCGELLEASVTLRLLVDEPMSRQHGDSPAWEKKRSRLTGVATGCALSDDGLWRLMGAHQEQDYRNNGPQAAILWNSVLRSASRSLFNSDCAALNQGIPIAVSLTDTAPKTR